MPGWFDRQRYMIDFTIASLLRRKGRNLGLLLVYGAIVFMLASVMLFSHSLRQEALILLQASPEVVVQRMVAGRHDMIPATYVEPIKAIRGTRHVHGRLWGYYFDPTVSANYTVMAPPDAGLERNQVKVGAGLARARGAGRGDVLALRSSDGRLFSFRVVEELASDSELISADLILMNEEDWRDFFGVAPGLYTDMVLTVRNPKEVRTVAQKIATALPDSRPILREEILRTYDSLFDWREGMMLVLLTGAVLAFAIFAWDKASGLSAEEKREIGVLKAVGWETSDIIAMKFWEGALVSLLAFIGGYLLAYVHVFHMSSGLFEPVLKGWAVLYPSFSPTPFVDGLQVVTLLFFTVLPYTVATIVPIWRAAIVDPDQVMRQ